jgi:hypothetical protein
LKWEKKPQANKNKEKSPKYFYPENGKSVNNHCYKKRMEFPFKAKPFFIGIMKREVIRMGDKDQQSK